MEEYIVKIIVEKGISYYLSEKKVENSDWKSKLHFGIDYKYITVDGLRTNNC